MSDFVLQERVGQTLIIKLNRPERKNAFDLEVREQLAQSIMNARNDDEVKAVILTGSGDAFCAGGDLKSLSEGKRPIGKDRERIRNLHIWFQELVNLEKPVIAAVDGPAFGAGFNLALACDFILGTSKALFCAVFGRIGLVPDLGGFFLLPRIVGLQKAKEIIFTARTISAQEAKELGILYEIVEQDNLLDAALELAARFHTASGAAIGMAKNILNRSFNLDQSTLAELESYAQALAIHTDEHSDAVQNFLNKRPLDFVWQEPSFKKQGEN